MILEPQQAPVLLVGKPKGGVFFCNGLMELRAFQLLGKPFRFLWKPAPSVLDKAGKITGFFGSITKIVTKVPKFFCQLQPLISFGLGLSWGLTLGQVQVWVKVQLPGTWARGKEARMPSKGLV